MSVFFFFAIVSDRIGSLAVGKDATLIIADGDILETETNVTDAFIQGRVVDLGGRRPRRFARGLGGRLEGVAVGGQREGGVEEVLDLGLASDLISYCRREHERARNE